MNKYSFLKKGNELLYTEKIIRSDKYNSILTAAGSVFAEFGFHKSTIAQIAAEAGVADGTIYLYFKNKEDILYQFLSYKTEIVFKKMRRAVNSNENADIRLRNLIRSHLKEFQDDKNMAVVFQSEVRYIRDIAPQIKNISRMYLDLLTEIIEQGQIEGTIRQELFMGVVKQYILGSVEGVINTWLSTGCKYDLASMADPLVELYLRGIENREKCLPQ